MEGVAWRGSRGVENGGVLTVVATADCSLSGLGVTFNTFNQSLFPACVCCGCVCVGGGVSLS